MLFLRVKESFTEMRNNSFVYALASAIIRQLWVKGLLTDDEYIRIDEKNKISFLKK